MNPKIVLVLGARKTYWPVLNTLKEMGFRTIALDRDAKSGASSLADVFETVDIVDQKGALAIASRYHVDAVMALNDLGVRTAAYVSTQLSLIGLNMQVADIVNDKGLMRDCWSTAKLPQPDYAVVQSVEEAAIVAESLGYPVVIKPTDCGGGSRGVSVARNAAEVKKSFDCAQIFVKNNRIIVEQYIRGVESQIEVLCYQGQAHAVTVCDKEMTLESEYRVSKSINYPAYFDKPLADRLKNLAESAALASGVVDGAAHVEVIVRDDGELFLQEIGGRPGGAYCSNLIPQLTTGVNFIEQLANILLGEKPDVQHQFNRGACYRFFIPSQGTLKNVYGLDMVRAMNGVVDIDIYANIGKKIGPAMSGVERSGHVLTVGDSRNEAYALADRVEQTLMFDVEPNE